MSLDIFRPSPDQALHLPPNSVEAMFDIPPVEQTRLPAIIKKLHSLEKSLAKPCLEKFVRPNSTNSTDQVAMVLKSPLIQRNSSTHLDALKTVCYRLVHQNTLQGLPTSRTEFAESLNQLTGLDYSKIADSKGQTYPSGAVSFITSNLIAGYDDRHQPSDTETNLAVYYAIEAFTRTRAVCTKTKYYPPVSLESLLV